MVEGCLRLRVFTVEGLVAWHRKLIPLTKPRDQQVLCTTSQDVRYTLRTTLYNGIA